MLSEVADSIGRVQLFRSMFPTEHMVCTVASLYAEIVGLLESMIAYWKRNRLGSVFIIPTLSEILLIWIRSKNFQRLLESF